jgi:hypothetical protein
MEDVGRLSSYCSGYNGRSECLYSLNRSLFFETRVECIRQALASGVFASCFLPLRLFIHFDVIPERGFWHLSGMIKINY